MALGRSCRHVLLAPAATLGLAATLVLAAILWLAGPARAEGRVGDAATLAAPPVSVGGLVAFADLGNPANTARLRATGRAGLYLHAMALAAAGDAGRLPAIYAAFRGTGPAHLELGFEATPEQQASYLAGFVPDHTTRLGQAIDRASVNGIGFGFDAAQLGQWHRYVDLARGVGLRVVAPVFAPNATSLPLDFDDPGYAGLKQAALYGGGLTIDAPPGYWHDRGPAYQACIAAEVGWARRNRLHVTMIISPWGNGLLAQTQAMLAGLRALDAMPDEFAVETYNPALPVTSPEAIGNDREADSITGVALWLAVAGGLAPPQH